jgi:hypothetical protein
MDGSIVASKARSLTVENPLIPITGFRAFGPAPLPAPQPDAEGLVADISATNLFPFASGYSVYAGNCLANNPEDYNADYFTNNPGYVETDPAGGYTVMVRTPAINIEVRGAGAAPLNNAEVYVRPVGSCGGNYLVRRTNSAGQLITPGFPFGDYTVCVDNNGGSSLRSQTITVQNRNPDGTALTPVQLTTSTATSTNCTP